MLAIIDVKSKDKSELEYVLRQVARKQFPKPDVSISMLRTVDADVLNLLYLSNKEIAERLCMKLRTVEKHMEDLLAYFKVENRTQLAIKAMKLGIYYEEV